MLQISTIAAKAAQAALVFRAVKHDLRQQILVYLQANPGTNVTTLYQAFRIEQSVASQHLAILRKQGLVLAERDGKEIRYSVNAARLQEVEAMAEALTKNVETKKANRSLAGVLACLLVLLLSGCAERHTPVSATIVAKRPLLDGRWTLYEYVTRDSTHLEFLTRRQFAVGTTQSVLPCQAKRIWQPIRKH